jgi:hypothetical protein
MNAVKRIRNAIYRGEKSHAHLDGVCRATRTACAILMTEERFNASCVTLLRILKVMQGSIFVAAIGHRIVAASLAVQRIEASDEGLRNRGSSSARVR